MNFLNASSFLQRNDLICPRSCQMQLFAIVIPVVNLRTSKNEKIFIFI